MTAPTPSLTFRGGPVGGEPGDVLVEPGFLATSLDVRIATENFAADGVLAVLGTSGRFLGELSSVPEEQEVVFPLGTRLLVVATGDVDGIPVTVAVAQDGAPEPDHARLTGIVVDRVRAARAQPPVELPRTGRFRGPIGG